MSPCVKKRHPLEKCHPRYKKILNVFMFEEHEVKNVSLVYHLTIIIMDCDMYLLISSNMRIWLANQFEDSIIFHVYYTCFNIKLCRVISTLKIFKNKLDYKKEKIKSLKN